MWELGKHLVNNSTLEKLYLSNDIETNPEYLIGMTGRSRTTAKLYRADVLISSFVVSCMQGLMGCKHFATVSTNGRLLVLRQNLQGFVAACCDHSSVFCSK